MAARPGQQCRVLFCPGEASDVFCARHADMLSSAERAAIEAEQRGTPEWHHAVVVAARRLAENDGREAEQTPVLHQATGVDSPSEYFPGQSQVQLLIITEPETYGL